MENLENTNQVESHLSLNSEIKGYLLETAKWGKFLAIMGYIGMAFLILVGLVMAIGLSAFSGMAGTGVPLAIMGVLYIVIAVIYYFPVSYLFKFSTKMKNGLTSNEQQTVTEGFENMKSLYKFLGILTIVVLSIYVLAIIVAVPMLMFFKS
jgi:hypothetical protein